MDTRLQNQAKSPSVSSVAPVQTGLFQQRPFNEVAEETTEALDSSHQQPDLQTQLDRAARFGHNFSRVQVKADSPAVIQPQPLIGQQQEQEDEQEADSVMEPVKMMAPPLGTPIQRFDLEEEPLQRMPQLGLLNPVIQREDQQEEPIQMMPQLGLLNPVIQREVEEDEPIQRMPQLGLLNPVIQREVEEDEPIQRMPQWGVIQRQEAETQEELIQSKLVQPKLVVGQPGDKYEQEADSMAAQVMSMSAPPANSGLVQRQGEQEEKEPVVQKSPLADSITPLVQRQSAETEVQRKCAKCEQEEQEEQVQTKSLLQRAAENGSNETSSNIESQLSSSKGGGNPLPDEVRSFMEPRFGADFSSVRVHSDAAAVQMNKALGAQAFAHGNDIFYGAGKSPGKNELTAHELTHTIQQGGGVQAKLETPDEALSEAASTKTDSSGNGQTQTAVTPVDSQTKTEPSKVEAPNTEHSSQELGAQAEAQQNGQGDKEKLAQSGQPKLSVSVETASSQGNAPQGVETGSEAKAQGGTNPATQAVQAVNPQQQVKLPSEVQAQAEGKQTQGGEQAKGKDGTGKAGQGEGKALEQVPQSQALKEATAQNQAASPKPEGSGEAANLPAEAENQQSKAVAEQGKAQLEATNAQAQQLASAGVNFAPPEEEQAGQVEERPVIAMKAETPGGDSAALKERSAKSSSIASSFVATASGKVQTITGLGAGIPVRIQATAENAKARVRAAVEQQKAAVTAQITQQRAKAHSKAQATIAQIQAQYQAAVGAIPGETAKAREKVSAEYATSVKSVDAREKSQVTQIEGIYARAGSEFRNAGARVGDEAVRIANQKASEYKSRDSGAAQVASFLGLGAVSDVAFGTDTLKNKARAQAAESVGQEYKKALIAKGEECAKQAEQGKQKDIDTVRQTAAKSRETLQTQQKAALDSLNAAEQQAKQQAQQAQTQLNQTANQSLEATLTSLDQQQATQLQMLTAQGQQQIAAIEGSAQKAIASLQNAINQSASGLRGTLQTFQAQAKTAQAPDPDALSAAVAQAQGQIDGEIGKIRAQVEQGIAASVQSITQSGQQSVEGLSSVGQGAIESATTLSQGLTTTMTGLAQSATDTFKQIQQAHTKTTAQTATTAVDGFKQVTEGIEKTFQEMSKGLESQFQQHVKEVEKALQGALKDLPAVINEEAEKAAAQVDPTKELLKLVVIVAVVVVAALVVGPFAAGLLAPLGAMGTILAGAAVGALSGAVIQMASNAIDGKNILEGVGQAALGGAIGGALGAGIGMAVGGVLKGAAGNVANRLGERAGSGLRSAGNFALDVAEETIGDIATNIATGQFSWDSIGESLLFSVFGAGLSRSGAGQRISDGAQNRGTQVGNNVSNRVRDALGGSTGDRTPIDVSTPRKPPVVEETAPAKPPVAEETTPAKPPVSEEAVAVKPPVTEETTAIKPPAVEETTHAKPPVLDETTPAKPSVAEETAPTKPPISEETTPAKPLGVEEATATKPPVAEETTPNGRSTHADKPEVEPSVVAKEQTADGHEIKVLKDGRVVRCSDCGEIRNKYANELNQHPELNKRLNEIEKIADPQEKARQAQQLEQELAQIAKTMEQRATLKDPNAIDFFDQKFKTIVGDGNNPQKIVAFERYLDATAKRGDGDLEKGLLEGYRKANKPPEVVSPHGEMVSELPRLRQEAENLKGEIKEWLIKNKIEGGERLIRTIENELKGPMTNMETKGLEATKARIEGFENNLKGVRSEFEQARTAPPGTEIGGHVKFEGKKIEIDQIHPDGTWINVKNYELFGLNNPKINELITQAEMNLRAAEANLVNDIPPTVVFDFAKGVTPEVAARLRAIELNGRHIQVTGKEIPLPQSN
jgi:hypothetical protein